MHESGAGRGGTRTSPASAPRTADGEGSGPPLLPNQRGGGGGGPEGGPPRRGRGRRVLKWLAIGTVAVVLGTAGAGYGYYVHLNHNIRKGQRSSGATTVHKAKPNAAGQTPLNVLLIGSDSRNTADDVKLGGSRENQGGPSRADVEMLLHVSADHRHAAIVSIPRDTRVDIPQCTDPKTGQVYRPVNDIITESLSRGGPGCTLATWQNLTGVYVDHWMMVDFEGVVRMADAVGGVDVCVKENLWDRPTPSIPHGGSGLKLTAGTHRIKGKKALEWLRTRDSFGSDLGRAKAQHMYLASMLRELRSQNIFTDPARLMGLADTATRSVEVSQEIGTVGKLYDLGEQLKNIPPDRITMATMPNVTDPQAPQAHLLPDPVAAPKLWSMLRNDVPFDKQTDDPATAAHTDAAGGTGSSGPAARPAGSVPVTVVNGTADPLGQRVAGRAGAVGAALADRGFALARTGPSVDSRPGTTVVYPAADGAQGRADALAVAGALHIPAGSVQPSAKATVITLTVGTDWPSGTDYAGTVPAAGDVPGNADALSGSDTGACMDVYGPYQW